MNKTTREQIQKVLDKLISFMDRDKDKIDYQLTATLIILKELLTVLSVSEIDHRLIKTGFMKKQDFYITCSHYERSITQLQQKADNMEKEIGGYLDDISKLQQNKKLVDDLIEWLYDPTNHGLNDNSLIYADAIARMRTKISELQEV